MVEAPHPGRLLIGLALGWFARDAVVEPLPVVYEVRHELDAEADSPPAGRWPEDCELPSALECEVCDNAVALLCWERECYVLGVVSALAALVLLVWLSSLCAESKPKQRRARVVVRQ